ncbi:MAG: saccharopine dehydrogenase NADP-binding domain-containing protein, partial [Hyphomonas sp.]|nr:saccharopine dehydrogenase NADP-binding domain-containing protein [Hyphomonas sp.]
LAGLSACEGHTMKHITIIGAGKIGGAIARMLAETGDYKVTVADRSAEQLGKLDAHPAVEAVELDITDAKALDAALAGQFAVLSAAPFHLTGAIAESAARTATHYLDLTEDVATTRKVEELARGARSAFIPQCGLAPGFISIVANDLTKHFDTLDTVRMRVGALPQYPSNALNYNLTWSTDGLINEYIEPCEAIVEGKLAVVPAMEEREEFSSKASWRSFRPWKSARNSRWMASPTRPSTPRAVSARWQRRWKAGCVR